MATPCVQPAIRRDPRSFVRRLSGLLVAAAAVLGIAAASLPAHADEPTTSTEAAALVAAKGHELEAVTERFNTAKERLDAAHTAALQAAAAAEQAQQDLDAARARIRGVARTAYTSSNLSHLQALLTSSSAAQLVDRMTMLNSIAGRQNQLLARASRAQGAATRARVRAQSTAEQARGQYQAVLKQQTDLQGQINAYQAAFNRLSAQEQQAARNAAGHGDPRASRTDRATGVGPTTLTGPVVTGNAAVQAVIDTALAQRGKPYVWAAAGPDSFDCSGLVQYAFRAAGISLPHSSSMQAQMGRPVSRAEARPGDLVFFYTPVSHIGIYLGNGLQVHAPTSGDVVKVAGIDGFGDTPRFTRIID